MLIELGTHVKDCNTLDLSGTDFSDKDIPSLMKFLKENPSIIILDLSWTKVTSKTVVALSNDKQIVSLNISFNKIGDEGLIAIAQNVNSISTLIAEYSAATEKSTKVFSENRSIRELHLGNNITEVIDLYDIRQDRMEFYFTNANQIGDIGAISLARMSNIKTLHLTDCGIGSQGAIALFSNETLEELNISSFPSKLKTFETWKNRFNNNALLGNSSYILNKIDEEAIIYLSQNKSLRILNLEGIPLSLKSLSALTANMRLQCLSGIKMGGFFKLKNPTKDYTEIKNDPITGYCKVVFNDEYDESEFWQAVDMILNKNPIQRVNTARKYGIATSIPSLCHLSVFAVAANENMERSTIKNSLTETLEEAVISQKDQITDLTEPTIERHMNKPY